MATITTINGTDVISTSRTTINTNFTNLNTDKLETSYLDTDNTLAANSDVKIPSQKAVKTYIDTSGGANASETVRGIVEEATDAEVTAGTATGGTGAKLFITPAKLATYITTFISTYITPLSGALTKFIGVGSTSNTSYSNFQILYGSANTVWNWTSTGTPTYSYTHLIVGSAQGVSRPMPIDLSTGASYTYANTKIKIMEWEASIVADVATALSFMGFVQNGTTGTDWGSFHRKTVGFGTDASGVWYIVSDDGTTTSSTSISTPSAGKHTFRLEYNPVTPLCTYYIDGVSVGTKAVNLPTSTSIDLSFTNGSTSTIISGLGPIHLAIEK